MTASSIPAAGFLRLWQIVGCKRRKIDPIIPVSRSSWYSGCKSGKYPAPVQLGPRTTAWRAEDIRNLIAAAEPHQDRA